jgi:hypothetical protein
MFDTTKDDFAAMLRQARVAVDPHDPFPPRSRPTHNAKRTVRQQPGTEWNDG